MHPSMNNSMGELLNFGKKGIPNRQEELLMQLQPTFMLVAVSSTSNGQYLRISLSHQQSHTCMHLEGGKVASSPNQGPTPSAKVYYVA